MSKTPKPKPRLYSAELHPGAWEFTQPGYQTQYQTRKLVLYNPVSELAGCPIGVYLTPLRSQSKLINLAEISWDVGQIWDGRIYPISRGFLTQQEAIKHGMTLLLAYEGQFNMGAWPFYCLTVGMLDGIARDIYHPKFRQFGVVYKPNAQTSRRLVSKHGLSRQDMRIVCGEKTSNKADDNDYWCWFTVVSNAGNRELLESKFDLITWEKEKEKPQ